MKHSTGLYLDKVSTIAVVVHAASVEARASSFPAKTGDERDSGHDGSTIGRGCRQCQGANTYIALDSEYL